ncbi:MAG: ACP S-malonyltransferase [Saprospiraceae bacterium]|jgi:[acyl-carrier-protein] S-malonyltransferase|nr:MAG: ACP S-malonyltransferase [Candidatus Parvibacillus calidus]MBX2936240.1 ACP S-malonyltransferase [Saprospiraceae bacterium]MBK7739055.1 ACP S-malonyltransferase [Candidatus Parvibacillus calidus]MBX7179462.1 ACP S-malonyltransferase [Saprospiraceae bacterium]MCB0590901.1 ACP S-malonyltransferase [Saprospiraceae bacterium]
MKSYLFPGQGAQFLGMGKDMYDQYDHIARMFEEANKLLGFEITDILFGDDEDALKRTDVTQPAIYIHSMAKALILGDDFRPDMAAGHSLGEFSALAACGAMTFEDGLRLVSMRAKAMQEACEANPGTMAAVLGLDDQIVEEVCGNIDEVVVPANYNCPGQLVISGSLDGIKIASEKLLAKGALKVVTLQVGGAFHSPLMADAQAKLEKAIRETEMKMPTCKVYQNVNARPGSTVEEIRQNLIEQLTAPVRWTQTMQNMIADGMTSALEVGGTGSVLRGLLRKVDRSIPSETA